jgi:hypothetical protein
MLLVISRFRSFTTFSATRAQHSGEREKAVGSIAHHGGAWMSMYRVGLSVVRAWCPPRASVASET